MKLLFVGCCLVACGCAGPLAPSEEYREASSVELQAAGEGNNPTADPPFPGGPEILLPRVVSGPSGCFEMATQPDVLHWVVEHVPLDMKIDKGYMQGDEVSCDPVEPKPTNLRTQNDHLRFERDPVVATTVHVWFDRNTYDCARTQIDVSFGGQVLIGVVGRYAQKCEAPPPPTPPVDPPKTDCRAGVVNPRVSGGVASVTIRPGYRVALTLRSYLKLIFGVFLPQFVKGNLYVTLDPGDHRFEVGIPIGLWQSDLYCGHWPIEDLTEANFPAYNAAILAYDYN